MDTKSSCFRSFPIACGLKNAVFARHKQNGPPTRMDNASGTVIDGIFCHYLFNVIAGGCGAYNQRIPSDHMHVWVDFKLEEILEVKPTIPKPKAVTLQPSSPPSRDNYNGKSWKRINKEKSMEALKASVDIPKEQVKDHHKKDMTKPQQK